ncbi:MAG: EAL domain-containing protein [Asticcacaulis sp.]
MYRVLACLRDQHDWVLVGLAALVCVTSSVTAIILMRRALTAKGRHRIKWILTAGASAGFGIWATHFIAMMAYDPGVLAGYDGPLTLLSLMVAVAVTGAGIALSVTHKKVVIQIIGGAVAGSGIALMHYTGMASLRAPAYMVWAPDLVIVSIIAGMVFAAAAFWLALRGASRLHIGGAAGLMVLAIVSHHFIAMGAVTLMPDPLRATGGMILSTDTLSAVLATTAIGVMILCLGAVISGRRLEEKERHFRVLIEAVNDYAICMLDPEGRVSNWNAGAQRFKGYAAKEIVGRRFDVFYPEVQRRAGKPQQALQTALENGRYEEEGLRIRKGGSSFFAHVIITPIRDASGTLIGFAKVTQDITQRKADQNRMAQTAYNLDVALKNMSQGLLLFDAEERLVLGNPQAAEIFGVSPVYLKAGAGFKDLLRLVVQGNPEFSNDLLEERYQVHRKLIEHEGGGTIVSEMNQDCIVQISHSPMSGGGWVTTIADITERRRDEARIHHMARHDGLTGLPNREHFNRRLDEALDWAPRTGKKVAAIAIDLDRFKEINDLRGHAAGDTVLQTIAARLKDMLGEDEFTARLGGDEFACIKYFSDSRHVSEYLDRIQSALLSSIDLDGFEVSPGGSLGVAIYPDDAADRETLMNNADLALYRAKSNPTESVCFYEARMDEAARDRRALAKDLWEAVKLDQFTIHYQVQKSVTSQEVMGYEALLRWKHPTRGNVSPADFIPVAEECGAIVDIGEWVLRTACEEAAKWPEHVRIAVNLSPVQLNGPDLVRKVHEILITTGLSPKRLELEITETTIIGDKVRALHLLRQIKALGVSIAIDDFGTGYSSLDTLNSFPFDKIKIDRSFLMEAEQSPQARAIIRAILALGKSLNVPVLAEGVETESQLGLLQFEGCDEAQGYYLGRPAPNVLDETQDIGRLRAV